jgi:sterol 14alpha-demethylase
MMTKTRIPPVVSGGRPLIGHMVEFLRSPEALIERGYREHGKIFSIRLPGRSGIVMLGSEHGRFLFGETDKRLSIRKAYPFFKHMLGPDNYFLAEYDEYKRQREIVLPRFQGRQMQEYVQIMERQVGALIDQLGDQGELDLVTELGPLVMRITADCFLGADFAGRLDDGYFQVFREFTEGIDPLLPGWFPAPHLRRSRRARNRLRADLRALLADRRANPVDPPDFMQVMAEARYADGEPVPEHVRVNLILTLVVAGHDTTTGHLSWGLVDLLRNPGALAQVYAEQEEVLDGDRPLDIRNVHGLAYLDRALHESERLHPITSGIVRIATEQIDYAGYRLPKGAMVTVPTAMSHRLGDVFADPDRYHPDRYLDDPAAARSLVGFGGGVHRCLGVHFAYLQMKVVITRLLQRFDLELLDTDPRPEPGQKLKWPQSPCRVRYRKRSSS